MTRKETLDGAAKAVLQDRQSTHGPPEDSFGLTAKFWSGYLGMEIKDYDVGVLLGLLKIARFKFKPTNPDHLMDLAGYSACANELVKTVESKTPVQLIEKVTKGILTKAVRCHACGEWIGEGYELYLYNAHHYHIKCYES